MNIDVASIYNPDYIKANFPKYKRHYECSRHLAGALKEFKDLLVKKRECVVDGELYNMINLEGTVAVVFKGNTYNIPLRVLLREDYPETAPIIYVTPTEKMILGKNLPYVNDRGKISIQYLDNWDREYHPDLYKILHKLCILFADNPPVWTKRTNTMVEAIELRSQRYMYRQHSQETQGTTREPRQQQSSISSRGAARPMRFESTHGIRPSVPGMSSSLPGSDAPSSHRGNYRSVAYGSQSSSGSSSTKSTPSPSQSPLVEGFVPFDPPQITSPGSFVLAAFESNNTTTNNTDLETKQPGPNSEAALFRSQSVPSNFSSQKSFNVLTMYKRIKKIGSGGFAKVYLYENEKTGEKVACKVVDLGANDEHVHKCSEALRKEVQILSTLKHDFIISYLSAEECNNNLAMIMEYFPKGSLFSEMQHQPEKCFDESTTRRFTWQIMQGVKYLHENGVIHKDIKARNILVDNSDIIKIADFGISKKMEDLNTATTASKDHFASMYWQSPEYLNNEKYGRKTDVWSIGCTVVEMLVGKPPLLCDDITTQAAGMRILQGKVYPPENCSEMAKEFLKLCFRLQDTRPTARKLMEETEFPAFSL